MLKANSWTIRIDVAIAVTFRVNWNRNFLPLCYKIRPWADHRFHILIRQEQLRCSGKSIHLPECYVSSDTWASRLLSSSVSEAIFNTREKKRTWGTKTQQDTDREMVPSVQNDQPCLFLVSVQCESNVEHSGGSALNLCLAASHNAVDNCFFPSNLHRKLCM